LLVAKDLKEAERKVKEYIGKENAEYPGETFYKCDGVDEFDFLDGDEIN